MMTDRQGDARLEEGRIALLTLFGQPQDVPLPGVCCSPSINQAAEV
jgi:hypothetical protein